MIVEVVTDPRILAAMAVAGTAYLLMPAKLPFPAINSYPGDLFNTRAYEQAKTNVRGLIERGLARSPGKPFTIVVPYGYKIVLPSSLGDWVKSTRDLDHVQLVRDQYFAGYTGFECQTVLHADDEYVKKMITTKLGQNDSTMPALDAALAAALDDLWGTSSDEWRTLDWQADTMGVIARAASAIFVGPEKARDREWLAVVQDYVLSYFGAVGDLHKFPAWARPFAHRFLSPKSARCRLLLVQARAIIDDVLAKRKDEAAVAAAAAANAKSAGPEQAQRPPVYNDALEWSQRDPDCKHHAADMQLALAMAAMFTTTELFRQVLIDLAKHPELVEPLRQEATEQLSAHGGVPTVAAVRDMVLLDSFIKESQRLSAPPAVIERAATRDVVLPDGQGVLPHGSHVYVDSTHLLSSEALYGPDPSAFDGYRFLRKSRAGEASVALNQSSSDFAVFGMGRHICPGRFFAANELKLAVAHVLLKYNIRHKGASSASDDDVGRPWASGFMSVVDPTVQMEVRRKGRAAVDGTRSESMV